MKALDSVGLVIRDTQSMEGLVARTLAAERVSVTLVSFFGVFALALALMGIYGVISYSTGRRTREIGIRMAMGARGGDVVKLVLDQRMKPVVLGAVLGVLGAMALSRFLRELLWDISPTDPATLISVVAAMLLAALAACYFPARRAAAVDPSVALRAE